MAIQYPTNEVQAPTYNKAVPLLRTPFDSTYELHPSQSDFTMPDIAPYARAFDNFPR